MWGGDCLTSEKSPPPAGQGTCPGHAAWGLVLKGPAGLFGPGMASAAAPGHLAVALEGRPGRAVSLQLLESEGVLPLSTWSAPSSPSPSSSPPLPLTSFPVQSPPRHFPSDRLRRLLCAARVACVFASEVAGLCGGRLGTWAPCCPCRPPEAPGGRGGACPARRYVPGVWRCPWHGVVVKYIVEPTGLRC